MNNIKIGIPLGDSALEEEFIRKVSQQMMPENSNLLYLLLSELNNQKKLEELSNYKMMELKAPSGETKTIYYDTRKKEVFDLRCDEPVELRANESPENAEENLKSMTLTDLQSIQTIVQNFLELKENIKKRNPNATIKIINDIIVVSTKVATAYFFIDENGEIPFAQATESSFPNFATEPQKKDYPKKDINNPFRRLVSALRDNSLKKLWLALKRRVLLPKTDDPYVVDLNSNNERPESSNTFFDEYLKDMGNFGNVITDDRTSPERGNVIKDGR